MVMDFLTGFVGVPLDMLSEDGALLAYALGTVMAVGMTCAIVYGLVIILRGWK